MYAPLAVADHGQPLAERTGFQALLKAAGIARLRYHDLRHGCASLLLAQGFHPRVAMEILGHSRLDMTMNLYSHVTAALQREAAGKMDALFAADISG